MALERPASPRSSSILSTNSETDFDCFSAMVRNADQKASSREIEVRWPFTVRDLFFGMSAIEMVLNSHTF